MADLELSVECFNLKYTLECGQCFRWKCLSDNEYIGVIQDRVIRIKQNQDKLFIWSNKKEQLEEVLGTLTEREQKVLTLRFGLEDGRARTLEEVGKEFNVTRERIRQIEAKALRKLRHPSRSRKLKDYLE